MKIAYLLLIHDNPKQALRLIRKINHQDVVFCIHLDKKMSKNDQDILRRWLSRNANVFFSRERVSAYLFQFNLIKATQCLIWELFKQKIDFEYAFLLSGSHYPIKTHAEIVHFLQKNKWAEFIGHLPLWSPRLVWWNWLERIDKWHFFLNIFHTTIYFTWPPSFLRNVVKRKIPEEIKFYGGGHWWCLSRECLEYVQDFYQSTSHKKLKNFFKYVLCPEEIFYETIILNSKFTSKVINNDLVYLDWSLNEYHPKILKQEDFEKLSQSDKLFARKFDISQDETILTMIDTEILINERWT